MIAPLLIWRVAERAGEALDWLPSGECSELPVDGLALSTVADVAPELLVLLPDADVETAVTAARQRFPATPLLVVTQGGAGASARTRALRAGANDCVELGGDAQELAARVHALRESGVALAALDKAHRQLREVQGRKRELAALVVHDLRNPLSTLRGNVQFVKYELEQGGDPGLVEALGDCEQLADKALGLVSTLLDVEDLEAGMLVPLPKPVSVAAFLPRCLRLLARDIERRSIHMDVRVEPPELVAVFDPDLVDRLLENLVENAVRYSTQGGRVLLSAIKDSDGAWVVRVGNDGAPIDPVERARIFHKYYRIEGRRASARANRGLGLYFCRLVAEAHKGSLEIDATGSEYATIFELRLPAP